MGFSKNETGHPPVLFTDVPKSQKAPRSAGLGERGAFHTLEGSGQQPVQMGGLEGLAQGHAQDGGEDGGQDAVH